MLILDATNKSIELVLGAVAVTNQLPFVAAFADHTSTAFSPAANDGQSNGATAVTIVAAPAASTQRQVKAIFVRNSDTAAAIVEVRLDVGGTKRILWRGTLATGDTLQFVDGEGWSVLDAAGSRKTSIQTIAGGSFTWYQHVNGGTGLSRYQIAGMANATALTTGAPSANNLRALPFVAPARGGVIDQLAFNVTTLLAGNARIGLYKNTADGNLYPGDLVSGTDSGSISTVTTGVKTFTVNVPLDPGRVYWLAHVCDAAATLRCLAVGGMWAALGLDSGLGTAPGFGITRAFTYAALPNPFGTTSPSVIGAVPIPALAARFSA
jgi:hypothetical protein